MGEAQWTRQTAESIAQVLREDLALKVCASTVRRLLRQLGYGLKSNKKCLSSGSAPGRDAQFRNIAELRENFATQGLPIISVDTKKKELVGLFKNAGQEWCKSGRKVNDHDFRSQADALAVPYGIYDVTRNSGLLVVGESADTAEFAVNCIVRWWEDHGRYNYCEARKLLLLADGGGSNSARSRDWKKCLQEKLVNRFGITVTVAHYPPGASKWNPIEHRMFSEISKQWSAKPLVSLDAIVNYAQNTITSKGLHIDACRDTRTYQKGNKVTDKQMLDIAFTPSEDLPKWNYSITPVLDPSTIIPATLTDAKDVRATIIANPARLMAGSSS